MYSRCWSFAGALEMCSSTPLRSSSTFEVPVVPNSASSYFRLCKMCVGGRMLSPTLKCKSVITVTFFLFMSGTSDKVFMDRPNAAAASRLKALYRSPTLLPSIINSTSRGMAARMVLTAILSKKGDKESSCRTPPQNSTESNLLPPI